MNFPQINEEPTRPVYAWVEKIIKKQVMEGFFASGDKIPSERELSESLNISRMTIRRAINNLIEQDILERRSSSGTYVRTPPYLERPIGSGHPLGLSKRIQPGGETPGSRLLHFVSQNAGDKVARRLNISAEDPVVLIRRLRTVMDTPICIETIYIPQSLVPGLIMDDLKVKDVSLYDLLENRYLIKPKQIREKIGVSYATEFEAQLLGIHPMDPVLLLRGVTYDTINRPFEYLVSVNHPDRVVFES